jgi:hypothetical protein
MSLQGRGRPTSSRSKLQSSAPVGFWVTFYYLVQGHRLRSPLLPSELRYSDDTLLPGTAQVIAQKARTGRINGCVSSHMTRPTTRRSIPGIGWWHLSMGKFIKRLQYSGHAGWLAQAPPVSRACVERPFTLLFWSYFVATYGLLLLWRPGVRNGAGYPCFCDAGPLLPGPAMGPAGFTYPSPRRVRAASFVDANFTGFGLAAELYSIGVANAAFLFGVRWAVPYSRLRWY